MMDFKKPQYYCKPANIVRRWLWKGNTTSTTTSLGISMQIDPTKVIGKSIGQSGVYDIVLSETLFRLCMQANFVIDIGANIGYTAGIAAKAMQPTGALWVFEPNPLVLPYLYQNIQQLHKQQVQVFPIALSNEIGEALLEIPTGTDNEGLAHIVQAISSNAHRVATETLDHLLPAAATVDVMKIDVEGHELAVLQGGIGALQNHQIKHIIFEDHEKYPSELSNWLLGMGYSIVRLEKGWKGVQLKEPFSTPKVSNWEPTNYLATIDEAAVERVFRKSGYLCLQKKYKK